MVSRWVGESEVKLWMQNGATFIPPNVGRDAGRVYVTSHGGPREGGPIRIDFAVPKFALQPGSVGHFILLPMANTPIHNVSIHIPVFMDPQKVLKNRGT
jgi:hypothetical protein